MKHLGNMTKEELREAYERSQRMKEKEAEEQRKITEKEIDEMGEHYESN